MIDAGSSQRRFRFDPSILVLLIVVAFLSAGVVQAARQWDGARRGLLLFERAQKDFYVNLGLIRAARAQHVPHSLQEALRLETVLVAMRGESSMYFGAGVIVADRHGTLDILTARHIVEHRGTPEVAFAPHVWVPVERILRSSARDLALIRVRAPYDRAYAVAKLASDDFASGTPFVVFGHPAARVWTASPGVAERHQRETLLFCPTCARGDSGAGAFDRSGRLRGIVVVKARVTAPSATTGKYVTFTAFETERPDAIRAFLRASKTT